ncbi:MAG: tol-pal system protein YbgF [Alphaproteobacteria bacterium]|nr:tol-pal system protein YbgF [Alphaproteobacteria bacterium]
MMFKTIRIAAVALAATVAFTSAPHAQSVTSAPAASENLTRLQSRVDELEALLREATADNERLSMDLRRARNENARLQRQTAESAPPPVAEAAPAETVVIPTPYAAPRAQTVTPPPSAAGQLGTLPAQVAPGDAAQAFREARRLLDATRWPEAEAALTSFLRSHPDSPDAPEARYFLGRTQIVVGHHSDAAATFVEFLRKSPTSPRAPDAWVRLGISLKGMGQTAQACATFRDLPAKYPTATAAIRTLAVNEARAAQCPAR